MANARTDFTFYTKPEYYRDITAGIGKLRKGDRVALATMSFKPQYAPVQALMEVLGAAAGRGVRVSLTVDAYVFLSDDKQVPGPLFFSKKLPRRMPAAFQKKYDVLAKLRQQGVQVAITNQPARVFTSPVGGRSHIKFAVINDRLYIGGCNLTSPERLDVMVGWESRKAADWLYEFSQNMVRTESTAFMHGKDLDFSIDTDTQLLVDSGKPKQSTIFAHAMQLIDEAEKEVLITCQYFPNSVTTKHLIAAHERGVKVTVMYNHPSKFPKPQNLLHYAVVARERLRTPPILFKQQLPKDRHYLHAKIIATESAAIIGSHNYVTAGVNFGTAEIALLRRDPAFSQSTVQFVQDLIGPTKTTVKVDTKRTA